MAAFDEMAVSGDNLLLCRRHENFYRIRLAPRGYGRPGNTADRFHRPRRHNLATTRPAFINSSRRESLIIFFYQRTYIKLLSLGLVSVVLSLYELGSFFNTKTLISTLLFIILLFQRTYTILPILTLGSFFQFSSICRRFLYICRILRGHINFVRNWTLKI